ncbi:MAG: LCP family protein [Clostridia bacterium]|nr:LCP family protein [Clostridia bacterium]
MKKAQNPPVKSRREWRFNKVTRILTGILGSLLILAGVVGILGGTIGIGYLNKIQYDDGIRNYNDVARLPADDRENSNVDYEIKDPVFISTDNVPVRGNTDSVTNVMLLGIDGRKAEGYTARSDTNMILSVNTDTRTIKLVSLLRDTWVTIPGLDFDGDGSDDIAKLNSAFYYGGFTMLSDTIRENFNLDIDRYIAVDFEALEKAIDVMGGIDMELTAEEAGFIPKWSDDPDRFATPDNPDLEPLGYEGGIYHLNGQQALAYSRIRNLYLDSDFTRQDNQRRVIEQLLAKAQSMNFGQLTGVLDAVLPYVQTNMSHQELLDFAVEAMGYSSFEIQSDKSVPHGNGDFTDGWIGDGLGLWLNDIEQSTLELHQYLYNTEPTA